MKPNFQHQNCPFSACNRKRFTAVLLVPINHTHEVMKSTKKGLLSIEIQTEILAAESVRVVLILVFPISFYQIQTPCGL